MIKKIFFTLILSIIFIVSLFLLLNLPNYYIENSKTALQAHLTEWINEEKEEHMPVILDIHQMDRSNSYLVIFKTRDESMIGYAHYLKGLNGKFKPDNYEFGTDKVQSREIITDDDKYLILVGMNPDLRIDYIKAPIVDEPLSYTFDVSNDDWFFRFEKIPKQIKHRVYTNLEFYNKNNEIIDYTQLF